MNRHILLLFFLVSTLFSRENPFFPTEGSDLPFTTNQILIQTPLKQASVRVPSTARTIESVEITYKNLDGTIANKKIELNNRIDWHLPIFISQSYQAESYKENEYKPQKKKSKKIISLPFIKFDLMDKKLQLKTKDRLLRSFLMVKPHRVVCDFERDTNIRSYKKELDKEIITEVRIGTHKHYYRVVVELDGSYKYKLDKNSNGYLISFN